MGCQKLQGLCGNLCQTERTVRSTEEGQAMMPYLPVRGCSLCMEAAMTKFGVVVLLWLKESWLTGLQADCLFSTLAMRVGQACSIVLFGYSVLHLVSSDHFGQLPRNLDVVEVFTAARSIEQPGMHACRPKTTTGSTKGRNQFWSCGSVHAGEEGWPHHFGT